MSASTTTTSDLIHTPLTISEGYEQLEVYARKLAKIANPLFHEQQSLRRQIHNTAASMHRYQTCVISDTNAADGDLRVCLMHTYQDLYLQLQKIDAAVSKLNGHMKNSQIKEREFFICRGYTLQSSANVVQQDDSRFNITTTQAWVRGENRYNSILCGTTLTQMIQKYAVL